MQEIAVSVLYRRLTARSSASSDAHHLSLRIPIVRIPIPPHPRLQHPILPPLPTHLPLTSNLLLPGPIHLTLFIRALPLQRLAHRTKRIVQINLHHWIARLAAIPRTLIAIHGALTTPLVRCPQRG